VLLGACRWAVLPFFGAILLAAGSAGQTGSEQKLPGRPLDIQQVLSWLPPDTETVIVARDFTLPDPETLQISRTYTQEWLFASLALRTWGINAPLADYFEGQKVSLAVQGSRGFRSPKSLGFMLFEGCALIVFADRMNDRAERYFKATSNAALRVEEIEGHHIAVFQDRSESDTWTTLVGFAGPNVLLVATHSDYLREMLLRIKGKKGPKALPETLPEWGYVDVNAPFWGLRHFDRAGRDEDPSSPFWDPSKFVKAPWTDDQAIGLTFSYDPAAGKGPAITYLSGNPSAAKETLRLWYEGKRLPSVVREVDAKAIAGSYSLEHPEAIMFTFYLTYLLGHGIFL
jgi:hypothetical protein